MGDGWTTQLGRLIREARERRHLSQAGLAEDIGVSQALVSLWELGERIPTFERLPTLARALDLPLADMLAADKTFAELLAAVERCGTKEGAA